MKYYDMFILELSRLTFSAFYYNQTKTLYLRTKYYHRNSNKNICARLFSMMLNVFEDESNLDECRIRHATDASIRCLVFVSSFFIFTIEIISVLYQVFNMSTKSQLYNGIMYLSL